MDAFLFGDISHGWRHVDTLTIREAACILAWLDPAAYRFSNHSLPKEAEAMKAALERAITGGSLPFRAAWEYHPDTWNNEGPHPTQTVDAHTLLADSTTLETVELARWCNAKGIEHPWRIEGSTTAAPSRPSMDGFPDELRAAVEAFEAVRSDPKATAGKTPKAAISEWLARHKPHLTSNARERIATVANWRPGGGAPRTPGE